MPSLAGSYILNFGQRVVNVGREVYQRLAEGQTVSRRKRLPAQWDDWTLRDMMFAGEIYQPSTQGGALKEVLRQLGKPSTTQDEPKYPIPGYFNPVGQIVRFYHNALAGSWGKEIHAADRFNGKPINPNLPDLLATVWRWSNLDHKKAPLVETVANHGTAGLRISVTGEGDNRRVFIDYDDPRIIKWADLDSRGNVVTVKLEYATPTYDANGNADGEIKVEETLSKYGFSRIVGGEETLTPAQRENPMEVCPYVLMHHEPVSGSPFGRHAYAGSERVIFGVDFDLAQLDESILAHIWPYLFATGAGEKPRKFTSNKYTLIYSRSANGVPQSTFDPMVPTLDFTGALAHIVQMVGWLRERQPQMVLNAVSLLSGISGETLQQVLKPADAESQRARMLYQDALRRAQQIAISLGIFNRLPGFDLGTGTGTKQAADAAYDDGQGPMGFDFNQRPGLPLTPYAAVVQATADVAERQAKFGLATAAKGVVGDNEELLQLAGYSREDAQRLAKTPPQVATPGANGQSAPLTSLANSRVNALMSKLQ